MNNAKSIINLGNAKVNPYDVLDVVEISEYTNLSIDEVKSSLDEAFANKPLVFKHGKTYFVRDLFFDSISPLHDQLSSSESGIEYSKLSASETPKIWQSISVDQRLMFNLLGLVESDLYKFLDYNKQERLRHRKWLTTRFDYYSSMFLMLALNEETAIKRLFTFDPSVEPLLDQIGFVRRISRLMYYWMNGERDESLKHQAKMVLDSVESLAKLIIEKLNV